MSGRQKKARFQQFVTWVSPKALTRDRKKKEKKGAKRDDISNKMNKKKALESTNFL